MAIYLLLTDAAPDAVLPAVRAAGIDLKVEPLDTNLDRIMALVPAAVLVDAVESPDRAFVTLSTLRRRAPQLPTAVIAEDEQLERHPWEEVAAELLSPRARAAEISLRLAMLRHRAGGADEGELRLGPLALNTDTYRVLLDGRPLDLTYKEFELLKTLAARPGRVFTREELLRDVWGYDFYGGARTVDVHVRRLRAKLGPEHEELIGTVRGVGYRASEPPL